MLLLDEGAHSHGLGLASRLRQRRAAFFRGLLPAARGGHADIGQERVAFLAFRLHEDNVRSFPGPYQVMFRSHIGEFLTDLLNEMAVKISPQPASLDVGIHAWKRRLHDPLLWVLTTGTHSDDTARPCERLHKAGATNAVFGLRAWGRQCPCRPCRLRERFGQHSKTGSARHSRLGKTRDLRYLSASWRRHQKSKLASQVPYLSRTKVRGQFFYSIRSRDRLSKSPACVLKY